VTEATETSDTLAAAVAPPVIAPETSPRPLARPARPAPTPPAETPPTQQAQQPAPQPEPQPQPEPESDPLADAIASAVSEAANAPPAPAPSAPSGPPMTGAEREAFRISVSNCWNVGALSTDALEVTVTVGLTIARDGRPDQNSIRRISASGGSEAGAAQAFEAARRAILRCGANGFDLPADKYDQWRDVELVFNPDGMRLR
jgi:hypothetical protein